MKFVLLGPYLRLWALLLLLIAPKGMVQSCQPSTEKGAAPTSALPERFHYVFVLDTSGSMMGLGDGKGRVIFPKVKAELKRFIERLPQESRVTLQTFDAGPGPTRTFALPEEKGSLLQYLDGLEAKGSQTYLYTTLLKILQEVERTRRANEAVSIYVFTDGKDNDPAPLTMEDVARKYEVVRGPYDWLFYISLGIPAPQEVANALHDLPNAQVLEAAPNQVPTLSEVLAKPSTLNLGNLWTSKEARRDIRLEACTAALNLDHLTRQFSQDSHPLSTSSPKRPRASGSPGPSEDACGCTPGRQTAPPRPAPPPGSCTPARPPTPL